jgi:hypothetical protein
MDTLAITESNKGSKLLARRLPSLHSLVRSQSPEFIHDIVESGHLPTNYSDSLIFVTEPRKHSKAVQSVPIEEPDTLRNELNSDLLVREYLLDTLHSSHPSTFAPVKQLATL